MMGGRKPEDFTFSSRRSIYEPVKLDDLIRLVASCRVYLDVFVT